MFWPARLDPLQWNGFRGGTDNEPRPSEHLPLRELANAMVALLDVRGPLDRTDLFALTRRLFGGKRVTPAVEARMTEALDQAVEQGRLVADGDTIRIA